jgi:hypothetical protein
MATAFEFDITTGWLLAAMSMVDMPICPPAVRLFGYQARPAASHLEPAVFSQFV